VPVGREGAAAPTGPEFDVFVLMPPAPAREAQ